METTNVIPEGFGLIFSLLIKKHKFEDPHFYNCTNPNEYQNQEICEFKVGNICHQLTWNKDKDTFRHQQINSIANLRSTDVYRIVDEQLQLVDDQI